MAAGAAKSGYHAGQISHSARNQIVTIMKIYTKSGDSGTTALFGGKRVPKSDPRIEAYGTVDELNSALGVARSHDLSADVDETLEHIQHHLFELGAQLATPAESQAQQVWVTAETIAETENDIDRFEESLPALTEFILPAGSPAAAALHLARTICRRAERRVVLLSEKEDVSNDAIVYLNRIGDFLFVLARHANRAAGNNDEPWKS
jgi:cob(I)alamin adenosyltransferase